MGVYRLEVSTTNRAGCNGKKPCNGTKIMKGELRMGTWVAFEDRGSFKWRHWGCVTPEQIKNLHQDFERAEDLDGFDEIPEPYQEKVRQAFKDGHDRVVADVDIPETARLPAKSDEEGEEGEGTTPKKPKKSKAKKEEAGSDVEEEKPKKKASKKAKAEPEEDGDEEEKPKPKARKKFQPTSKTLVDDEDLDDEEEQKPAKKSKKRSSTAVEVYEDGEDVKPAKASSSKKAKAKPAKEETDENKARMSNKKGRA